MRDLSAGREGVTVEQDQQAGKQWHVVSTKARNEETAQIHLTTKGIEVFYPKLALPMVKSGVVKSGGGIVPLFPNYLFVRFDALSAEYYQVLWCRGVKRVVSFGGVPATLADGVIDFIREQADSRGLIVAKSNLKVGDEVRITDGPFKGLVGIIQEPPDTRNRVRVLMAILSRQVQVEIPAGYIDMGWVAPCRAA